MPICIILWPEFETMALVFPKDGEVDLMFNAIFDVEADGDDDDEDKLIPPLLTT